MPPLFPQKREPAGLNPSGSGERHPAQRAITPVRRIRRAGRRSAGHRRWHTSPRRPPERALLHASQGADIPRGTQPHHFRASAASESRAPYNGGASPGTDPVGKSRPGPRSAPVIMPTPIPQRHAADIRNQPAPPSSRSTHRRRDIRSPPAKRHAGHRRTRSPREAAMRRLHNHDSKERALFRTSRFISIICLLYSTVFHTILCHRPRRDDDAAGPRAPMNR